MTTELRQAAKIIYVGVKEKLGLTYSDMQVTQVLAVGEESGEFIGSYRRWSGRARRDGSFDDVRHELADVVISAYVGAEALGFDLDDAISEKLAVVLTRGWKNPTPTG